MRCINYWKWNVKFVNETERKLFSYNYDDDYDDDDIDIDKRIALPWTLFYIKIYIFLSI